VFGLRGIGLNVIQVARMVGTDKIIGVDLNPSMAEMARKVRHDAFRQPGRGRMRQGRQALVDLTGGGADFSFEYIGNVQIMGQALECCHRGWGESIIIGVAPSGAKFPRARSSS
jgi:S-(hydroxymethyl)glutathione dehydrogenase/alcohol dehydrogenase